MRQVNYDFTIAATVNVLSSTLTDPRVFAFISIIVRNECFNASITTPTIPISATYTNLGIN